MGRVLRFLFALPLALAAMLVGFAVLANLMNGEARFTPASERQSVTVGVCDNCEPPPCVDCNGLPPKQPPKPEIKTPCQIDCGPWWPSEPERPSREIEIPDDLFRSGPRPVWRGHILSPSYPKGCIEKGAEGVVVVEFDITPEGSVANLRIIETPDRCFDQAVLAYVSRWHFKPPVDDSGRPTWRRGVREAITFQLTE